MLEKNILPLRLTWLVTAALAVLLSAPVPAFSEDGDRKGGIIGGLNRTTGENANADRGESDPGAMNVADSPNGFINTLKGFTGFDSELLTDGSVIVNETDGEGGRRETRIGPADSTIHETLPDGTEVVTEYGPDGKIVKQTIESPDSTTEITINEDGTSTEKIFDAEGELISTVIRDKDGRLISGERHSASGTETAQRNDDGSVKIDKRDTDGNLIKTLTVDADGNGFTDIDHKTGIKTQAHRERDKDGNTTSISTTTTNSNDGTSVERTATADRTETVEKDKDGKVTKRTINNKDTGIKTEIEYDEDGKQVRQLETKKDGSSRERWTTEDGTLEGVIRDGKGNVKEKFRKTKDGLTIRSKKTHWWDKDTIEYPDGSKKVIIQQKFGSKDRLVIEKDKNGKITGHHSGSSHLLEPGQSYYEKSGGRDWNDLSPNEKAKHERAANEAEPLSSGGPPMSEYARGVLERAKMRAETEKDVHKLATDGQNGGADKKEAPPGLRGDGREEESPKAGRRGDPPVAENNNEDPKRRRAELEKKSAEHAARAKGRQKMLDQALEDGDRTEIRKIEADMDKDMDDSLAVDSELAEMDARKNDPKEAARYRISQAIRKDAVARAQDMNKLDAELEDHTQAVAGKFSWVSAGADITTKTTDEARSADARRNLGTANLEAIARLEEMPGLLELRLGNLGKNKEAVAAAKKYLAGRKKFAQNQVDMGTSERNTITLIRAAGVTADVLDTMIGGKLASGGGKLVSRGLKVAEGAKSARLAPRLAQSGSQTVDTVIDLGSYGARDAARRGARQTTTLTEVVGRQAADAAEGRMMRMTQSSPTEWIPIDEMSEFALNQFVTDSTIIMRGLRPARLTVGHASRNVSPATIRRLWEKGRNLTREELLIKIDLILSETVPPTGPP